MKLSNNLMKAAIALFCAAAMASCIHDDNHRTPSTVDKDAKLETVSISMNIPGEVKNLTRADSDLPEIDIVEVDVLQFNPDGTFAHRAVGSNITGNTSGDAGAGSGEREFETKLLSGTYDLVIVANARTQVNDAATGAGAWDESTTMQAALDRLAVAIDADERVFSPGDDQAALQRVPMFGITKDRTVDKDHRDHTVEMVRMVAKVDIQLGSTAVSDVFHISGARLYNQPLKGWVTPKISGWPANNVSTSAYFGGAAAPAKASYSGSPSDEPILTTEALPLEGIFDEIYLFEAPAGSEAGRNTNTCLVVEGRYSPDGVWPAGEPSYYRVDFRRNTGTAQSPVWEYMPLLRNHHYTVIVNSVTGPGYPTPKEAFYGSARLEAEIVDWVQKPQNVIADGQYFLAVDKDLIELKGSGKRKDFTAETNYDIDDRGFPAGLQVKTAEVVYGPEDSGWLTVDDTNGLMARNIGMTATINVTGAVRTAKVMLRAGNMIKVIDVTQTPAGALAAPGTIGYSEETGELTLAGSMEYAGTIVAPDGTTAEFGPLSTETVYVAYYRWGSMVAIGSENTGAFTASNVVWAPDDYVFSDGGTNYRGTEALKRRIGTASGATAWNMVPGRVDADGQELGWAAGTQGQALGDPCSLFGENWFMPIGGPSNKGWNGGTFGSLNGKTWEQVQGAPEYVQARWVPVPEIPATVAPNGGAITSDGTIFLPATGRRSTIGEMSRTTDLFYWSNTPANSYSGFSLGLAADWVYGSNNSDYKTAIAVRCVQEPVRNDVVFAAPGVVGIKKSAYDWLKRQRAIASQGSYGITWIPRTESDWSEYTAVHGHPLTIKGSSTYAGTWVETNIADGGKTTEFTANGYDGLETEPVYTVYFKWGSMIAMIGGEGDAWSMDDVVWVNPEFTGTITSDTGAASSDSNYGDFSAAPKDSSVTSPGQRDFGTLNPALGHGDICEEITGGTWRIPTGRPFATTKTYTGVNSGGTTYPFGDYRTANPGRTWEQSRGTDNGVTYWRDASSHTAGTLGGYSVAPHVPIGFFSGTQGQGVSDNQDLFLPAAGYRLSSGLLRNQGSDGPYWSSSASGSVYGCSLNFTSSIVYSTYGSDYANGFPVRCVVDEPAPVESVLEVVDTQIDAFTHLGGSRSVAVTSTIDDEPAAWTAQFSVDGGAYSSTAPAWLAGFPTSGAGSITAETYTMSPAPVSLISTDTDFVGAGTRGSTGSPWNLAGNPANADLSNASDWETANSYIVNNPGWYSLPLAYGNAIKGGSFNPHSYLAEGAASTTFLKNFIRHDGKGISGSYIYSQTTPFDSPIGDATLLWQDVPGMLTDIKLDAAKEKLLFRIEAGVIAQGNAVVAVRDAAGAIMWSWHIWVTPSRIVNAMNPKAATRATKTFAGEYNDIMEYALGFVGTGTDVWAARSVSVRITQTGTGETKTIALSHPEKVIANGLVSTYYQWGRKDAMIPSNGNNDESRVVEWGVRKDGLPYNTTGAAATGEPAATIQNSQPTSAANVGDITKSIVNPHVFYTRNGDWNAGTTTPEGPGRVSVNNLWSVENTGMKVNDDVIKTVYDPSPAGFKMPLMDVWTGFTNTGGNQTGDASSGNWNVPQPVSSNPFASGWNFYLDGWQIGETSFYAAFGYRYATGGGVGSVASSGSYWSAIPYSASAGCDFTTRNNIIYPLNGNNRGFGFAVRPMAE